MSLRFLLFALLAVTACKKDAPPPAAPPTEAKEEGPGELDLTTAMASKTTDVYDVSLSAPETSPQNEQIELTVTVEAKNGMHVNPEYPINFRPVHTVNSVKYGREKFDLLPQAKKTPCEKGKDFCSLTAPVPFTIDVAGPRRVEGVLAFSVCDKNRCLIEKATLGMDVAAK
jgi:hypothetical protein